MGSCLGTSNEVTQEKVMPGFGCNSKELKAINDAHINFIKDVNKERAFQDDSSFKLIMAYFHFGGNQQLHNSGLYLPSDIIWLITTYKLQDLVIDENSYCILESGMKYTFTSIHLNSYSVLTVNGWNYYSKEGGILWLDCDSLQIDEGASINLNGKGYQGNDRHNRPRTTHETFCGKLLKFNNANGNTNYKLYTEYSLKVGNGDMGTKVGGNGGGCIFIECNHLIMNSGNIMAMGNSGGGGMGDGGMIRLNIKKKANWTSCRIYADKFQRNTGEIEINCLPAIRKYGSYCSFRPEPIWNVHH